MKYQTPMTIMNTTNGPMTSTRNDFHTDRRGRCRGLDERPDAVVVHRCRPHHLDCVMSAPRGGRGRRRRDLRELRFEPQVVRPRVLERDVEVADDSPGPA